MKTRKATMALVALATGLTMTAAAPGVAHAAKGGPKGGTTTTGPCTTLADGTLNCPYLDDEPGEYTENFYSGIWGSAGGGNAIVIGGPGGYWDAHVVYKLDQEAADTGVHDVVLQDKRVADKNSYSVKLGTLASKINAISDVNVTVGDCAAKPEANCISMVDFTAYSKDSGVGGYMSPKGLHDRDIAFNSIHMTGKQAAKILLHEGGHAFGLSHKHSSDGVMSYHLRDNTYSDDEIAALQLAYGGGTTAKRTAGTPAKLSTSPVH